MSTAPEAAGQEGSDAPDLHALVAQRTQRARLAQRRAVRPFVAAVALLLLLLVGERALGLVTPQLQPFYRAGGAGPTEHGAEMTITLQLVNDTLLPVTVGGAAGTSDPRVTMDDVAPVRLGPGQHGEVTLRGVRKNCQFRRASDPPTPVAHPRDIWFTAHPLLGARRVHLVDFDVEMAFQGLDLSCR